MNAILILISIITEKVVLVFHKVIVWAMELEVKLIFSVPSSASGDDVGKE